MEEEFNEEVVQYLKNANVYEDNMSEIESFDLYKTLKRLSQVDENIDKNNRRNVSFRKEQTSNNNSTGERNKEKSTERYLKNYSFEDLNKHKDDSEPLRPPISQSLPVGSLVQSPQFLKASTINRCKLLCSYFSDRDKYNAQLASVSLACVPLPAPINLSESGAAIPFTPSTSTTTEEDVNYTRSGRQTRRLYVTDAITEIDFVEDEDADFTKHFREPVVEDDEEEWEAPGSAKPRKRRLTREDDVTKKKARPNASKTSKAAKEPAVSEPAKRTPRSSKKLSNAELVKRSKLFADSPTTNKNSRTEKMFEKLKNQKVELEKANSFQEKFEKSLQMNDDSSDEDVQSQEKLVKEDEVDTEEVSNIKRRVVPPPYVQGRRGIRGAAKSPQNARVDSPMPASSSSRLRLKSTEPHALETKPRREVKVIAPPPQMTDCPVCFKSFKNEEVNEHAFTCVGVEEEQEPTTNSTNIMTCHICDKVILFEDYEEHVSDCLAKS